MSSELVFSNFHLLLFQKKLPLEGWDDLSIEHLLNDVALMDSNNFTGIYVSIFMSFG